MAGAPPPRAARRRPQAHGKGGQRPSFHYYYGVPPEPTTGRYLRQGICTGGTTPQRAIRPPAGWQKERRPFGAHRASVFDPRTVRLKGRRSSHAELKGRARSAVSKKPTADGVVIVRLHQLAGLIKFTKNQWVHRVAETLTFFRRGPRRDQNLCRCEESKWTVYNCRGPSEDEETDRHYELQASNARYPRPSQRPREQARPAVASVRHLRRYQSRGRQQAALRDVTIACVEPTRCSDLGRSTAS